MTYSDTSRANALKATRARVQGQYRGTGHYPVTVGGYVVGHVEKQDLKATHGNVRWAAYDDQGTLIGKDRETRDSAVRLLARTDQVVETYRQAALEGVFGFPEHRRVKAEVDVEVEELVAAQRAQARQGAHQPTSEPSFLAMVTREKVTIQGVRVLKLGRFTPGAIGTYAHAAVIGRRNGTGEVKRAYSTHRLIWNDDTRSWLLESGTYDLTWEQAVDDLTRR